MAKMDLIPQSYRDALRLRHTLKAFLVALTILLAAIGLGRIAFFSVIKAQQPALDGLRQRQVLAASQRARIGELHAAKAKAENRAKMLAHLRGGDAVAVLSTAIERALNDRVWLQEMKFLRAGEYVELKPEAVATGYFLVIPKDDDKTQGTDRAWRMQQSLELVGHALDHSAIAEFITRLGTYEQFKDVRLINSHVHIEPGGEVVDFSALALINLESVRPK
jgi:Tfp pilus assembly protein PilN